MFSAGGLESLRSLFTHLPPNNRKMEREMENGGGMWLSANRTQRHSETLAVLFFRSESGD